MKRGIQTGFDFQFNTIWDVVRENSFVFKSHQSEQRDWLRTRGVKLKL